MWVKICGMTNREDALAAVQAGADALGFVFVPTSPRAMSRKAVSEILRELPDTVMTVGVVANERIEFLKGLLRVCPLKAFQFHGDEPPQELLALRGEGTRLIKAIRVQGPESLEQIPLYRGVDAILLDAHARGGGSGSASSSRSHAPGALGGTGTSFDWGLAAQAQSHGIPVIAAGGLTPSTVASVIRRVRPYGVDVSSGVEMSPGRKDHALVREFILRAKGAAA